MGRPKNPENTLHKICPTCGVSFTCEKRTEKTYCSKKCACNSPETKEKNRLAVKRSFEKTYGGHPMAKNDATKKKYKDSMLEAHGVEWAGRMEDHVKKVKTTLESRYGDQNYNNIDQIKRTMIERYGVDNYRKSSDYIGKTYKTCIKKYGTLHPSKSEHYKDAHKRTMFKKFIESERFIDFTPMFSVDEYAGVFDRKYPFSCKRCGSVQSHDISDGKWCKCSKCDKKTMSDFQQSVLDYIRELLPNEPILVNDRTILYPQEIDIYIQSKRLAIELDGIFYHSEVMGRKNKMYHLQKTNACLSRGIRLIHVFENEWNHKRDIVKSVLKTIIGGTVISIPARKTEVREVDGSVSTKFLKENHLQGQDHSSIKLGLYYQSELVGLMTFVRSRFDKKVEWELSRFCTKLGHKVLGGASKLFQYFLRNYNPISIVSYSDRRYFSGEMYLKMGMTFVSNTPPNYWYIIDNYDTLQSRVNWQKAKLNDKLLSFDPTQSEWENMQMNGFDRIWDCGNLKFVWKNNVVTP